MGHNTVAEKTIEKEESFKTLCKGLNEDELYAVRRMKKALNGDFIRRMNLRRVI